MLYSCTDVFFPVTGRNEPLKKDRPKWKSDYPMTEGQLRSKRDEFWDTAPAFEGRKEIWDALKAAAVALECSDHELAQAIVDGASITLPHGQDTQNLWNHSGLTHILTGLSWLARHRYSHRVLRWTREPLPAARLLPGSSHQPHLRAQRRGPQRQPWTPRSTQEGIPAQGTRTSLWE